MSRPVICGVVRSPFTQARKGELARVRPDDLLAQVIRALLAQTKVSADAINDCITGCAFPEGEQGLNIARMAVFLAGLPVTVPGMTLNRWCGSSMEAVHIAAAKISSGAGDVYICAGVESMTRVPMGGFNILPNAKLYAEFPQAYDSMGKTAETVARRYSISRKEQEIFACNSHLKAASAQDNDSAVIAITTPDGTVTRDGIVRADSTVEKMAALPLVFDAKGTVTAATASPMADGACALLVCAESYADTHGLPKLARVAATSLVAIAPEIMGIAPVAAIQQLLVRTGLTLDAINIIEINEAFAAQILACLHELKLPPERVNRHGGALALGHPLGASGARIVGKAASLLQQEHANYALASMCIGGGQGIATLLEKI